MSPHAGRVRFGCLLASLIALSGLLACGENRRDASMPEPNPSARDASAGAAEDGFAAGAAHWARPRALWVLAEGSQRVLENPERLDALLRDAEALGASDLFVQVYRGGRAWYDAELADATPYRGVRERTGVDPLAELIERAHARALRVHAWVNVLSLSQNRDAPLLHDLGPQAVMVDRRGRSVLDYPGFEVPEPDSNWYRMGTRGLYLDPAADGVSERLVASFAQLVSRYPGLDGLHLDYARHPGVLPFSPGSRFDVGLDFGYGEASRRRFREETGLAGLFRDARLPGVGPIRHADAWDAWRRDRVSDLVAAIAEAARRAQPQIRISAAVNSYSDRAYLSLAQDWRRWLEEGFIDLAVAMVYTRDDRLLRYQLENFRGGPEADRIWAGLGVWLFAREPERALRQIEIARRVGSPGEALFSWDALADSPALLRALSAHAEAAGP